MDIGALLYKQLNEVLKSRNMKLTDWLIEKKIIVPDTFTTYDIDEIKPLGHLETQQTENIKPIYSKIFENKVKISDGIYDCCFYQKGTKLYNKAGVELGCIEDMVDKNCIMPKSFKNSYNIVINPDNGELLKQYIVYPGFEFYHLVQPKKYKTYKYDFELNRLIPTNAVLISPVNS